MNEPKPFASLSSGLLARKGAARPAMRPQGFGQVTGSLEDLGWDDMGFEPPKPAIAPVRDEDHDAFGEDLDEHPRVHPTGLTPVGSHAHSPVHSQQAEIVHRFNGDEAEEEIDETAELAEGDEHAEPAAVAPPAAVAKPTPVGKPVVAVAAVPAPAKRHAPTPRTAPGSKPKAAFTLRLDPDRHLKLRLACAVDGRSAQQIVTDALDQFLAAIPELDTLAQKAKRKG
ncbi:MAG: hypothetical protein QOF34_1052 [Sphingomonadales bacterium]|nr:hypothetical protein [Sphingomonadales bacterium]